jgi:hypothetical protein
MAGRPRWLGRTLVGLAIVAVAFLVPASPFRSLVAIHHVIELPDDVTTCGRDYTKDQSNRRSSYASIAAEMAPGFDPVIVDPGLLARLFSPCQPGACTRDAQDGPCATVVWVRVDWDAYVGYDLRGGP